jgi:hypothetical protein
MFDYKELAKEHNATASELMKGLVESMSKDKEEKKEVGKIMKKAYREWVENLQGEKDTITEALQVVDSIVPAKD